VQSKGYGKDGSGGVPDASWAGVRRTRGGRLQRRGDGRRVPCWLHRWPGR